MIYKRKTSSSYTRANNNTNFLYFSSIPSIEANNNFINILNNSSINTHTDRIIFNCYSEIKESYKLLFKALNDYNYISKKDKLIKLDVFKRRRLYIHSARHTYGTHLYHTTQNLRYMQKQLGHSSLVMTGLYADVLPEMNGALANKILS